MFALAVLAVPFAVQAEEPSAAPVVEAERAFARDGLALGITASFNKWAVPEAVMIAGGRAQTVRQVYPPDVPRSADEPRLEWWPNFAGIARSGELGFTTGGVAVNGQRTGHYFTIWKKQPDGNWRWVYDGGAGASARDVPGPDSEPVILPPGPELLQVRSADRPAPPAPPADWALTEVKAEEAALAREAVVDQKAAHLARGRQRAALCSPASSGDRPGGLRGSAGGLAGRLPLRPCRRGRAVQIRRPGLDLWPGGLDPRRDRASRPLCPPVAAPGGRVQDCAGPTDPGSAATGRYRSELRRPIWAR